MKKSVVLLIFIMLIILIYISLPRKLNYSTMDYQQKKSFLNEIISLLPECICHDVRRFIACQFALESYFGSAPSALCNNNYCGMKVSVLRITLALNKDSKGEFACFSGITSCVYDYLLWLQSNKFSRQELNNLESFIGHLNISGYCPDEYDYTSRINSLYYQFYGRTK